MNPIFHLFNDVLNLKFSNYFVCYPHTYLAQQGYYNFVESVRKNNLSSFVNTSRYSLLVSNKNARLFFTTIEAVARGAVTKGYEHPIILLPGEYTIDSKIIEDIVKVTQPKAFGGFCQKQTDFALEVAPSVLYKSA